LTLDGQKMTDNELAPLARHPKQQYLKLQFFGPHGLPVGDGSGGESVMPPQQRKIIAMRA